MTLCPIAIAVGCKKCLIVSMCPLKTVIGDYKKTEKTKPENGRIGKSSSNNNKPRKPATKSAKAGKTVAKRTKTGKEATKSTHTVKSGAKSKKKK